MELSFMSIMEINHGLIFCAVLSTLAYMIANLATRTRGKKSPPCPRGRSIYRDLSRWL